MERGRLVRFSSILVIEERKRKEYEFMRMYGSK